MIVTLEQIKKTFLQHLVKKLVLAEDGFEEDEVDDFGDRGSAAEPKESREKFKLCDIEFGFGNGLVNGNRCPMTSFPRASTEHNKQPHSTKALPPAA